MNEIIDYIKDSPIEYAIDALSVNYVIQTIVQMVLFPFVLYFCWRNQYPPSKCRPAKSKNKPDT